MTAINNTARNSFVLLQVGERRFAMRADIVAELAPPVRLHTFPHSSPLLAGVIVRRGRIVPVYDVALVLLGTKSPAHRFYLIAERKFGAVSEPSAVPLNGECELATAEIEPPDTGHPNFISGKISTSAGIIDILDFELLVTSRPDDRSESGGAEERS